MDGWVSGDCVGNNNKRGEWAQVMKVALVDGVAAFIVSAHSGFVLRPGARSPASLKGMKRHAAENVNKLRMVMIIS